MPDKKIEMLPFAPYSTKAIEDWINEEARHGWQVTGTVPFIPILIKLVRGEGGPYHILMDDTDEIDSVCVLPGCGFVVSGELDRADVDTFGQNTLLVKLSFHGAIFSIVEIMASVLFLSYANSTENFEWLSIWGIIGLIYICSAFYGILYSIYALFSGIIRFSHRHKSVLPTAAYYLTLFLSILTLIILLPCIFSEDAINGFKSILQNR